MPNYRHAFHAGNFADVLKHAVLARVLVYLTRKETPLRFIDTHAGAGRYDLKSAEATRSPEWREGVARVLTARPPAPVAELLIQKGANVNVTDGQGGTPLDLAAQRCHPQVISLLISAHADVNKTANNGYTPLLVAANVTTDSGRRVVGAQFTTHGTEPIFDGPPCDEAAMVRLLLAGGANPNVAGGEGETPLLLAAQNGNADAVKLLLKAGAKVDAAAGNGATALIMASYTGHADVVTVLLAAGANANASLRDGTTALAAANLQGHSDVAGLLKAAGAK